MSLIIGIADDMMSVEAPRGTGDYVYALLLVGSVIYLHWALRMFLVPLHQFPQAIAKDLRDAVYTRYAKSFLAGAIGLGYVLLALHIYAFLDRSISGRASLLYLAMFSIALGTFAQARATVECLGGVGRS